MARDKDIFESMILGGLIGAALGTLLTNKKDGGALGALAGSVILASYKANELAQKSSVPVLVEENNIIYEVNSKGDKKFIKRIPKRKTYLPDHFKLS